jgi:(p)ppGpp synthase/HD superfamily hydrolase
VDVRVDLANQRGALAIVASVIAETGANIENVSMQERDGKFSSIRFTLGVRNRKHLAEVMRRIRSLGMVARISRMKNE